MTFVVKRISDYGASNPVVARLSIQTSEIIDFFSLDKSRADDLKEIYFMQVQPRVLDCSAVATAISDEVEKVMNGMLTEGVRSQSHNRVIELPQVPRLKERAEAYLYNAKSALRDLSGVFRVLFGHEFGHSRYGEIHDWAKKTLGDDAPLTEFLSNEVDWIRYTAILRNSVEHPENKRRGPLMIQNFELVDTAPTGARHFLEPVWYFRGMEPASIRVDMIAIAHNLLTFAEDLVVVAHRQLHPEAIVEFAEIPESERRKECPIRLRAILNPEKMRT